MSFFIFTFEIQYPTSTTIFFRSPFSRKTITWVIAVYHRLYYFKISPLARDLAVLVLTQLIILLNRYLIWLIRAGSSLPCVCCRQADGARTNRVIFQTSQARLSTFCLCSSTQVQNRTATFVIKQSRSMKLRLFVSGFLCLLFFSRNFIWLYRVFVNSTYSIIWIDNRRDLKGIPVLP